MPDEEREDIVMEDAPALPSDSADPAESVAESTGSPVSKPSLGGTKLPDLGAPADPGSNELQVVGLEEETPRKRQHVEQGAAQRPSTTPETTPERNVAKAVASSPLNSPTRTTKSPMKSPMKSPIRSPIRSPMRSPMRSPARIPLKSSLRSPAKSPLKNSVGTPRLVIERLVLTNFKSYAGTQVVGPFHPSFSAVVGPNGSGKSNVIDSLLFVFGFRASKMRQSKLSELIHNSENFKGLAYCRVDVHFRKAVDKTDENGNEFVEYVPGSELVVSRKAMRDNSSRYYINEKGSSYTEVRDLLKDQGIDLDHKRFLILQGEVESIAQMKPKAEKDGEDGLLEYLEDIIGTAHYKSQIADKSARIDELNDICLDKEQRFDFVEKSKTELEPTKDEALQYLLLERELLVERSKLLQCTVKKDKGELELLKVEAEKLQLKIDEDTKVADAKQAENAELKKERDKLEREVKTLSEERDVIKKKHQKLGNLRVRAEEETKHHKKSQEQAIKQVKQHEVTLHGAEQTLELSENNLETYQTEEKQFQEQLTEEKGKLEEIKMKLADKTRELQRQAEALQKEYQPWKEQMNQKQGEIDVKQSELEIAQKRLKEIESEEKRLREGIEDSSKVVDTKRRQISKLESEKSQLSGNIAKGEPKMEHATKQLGAMEQQVGVLRQKVQDAQARKERTQSRGRVLDALNRLSTSGQIEGFYGRLGDLGVIPDEYDVAVSTGGGSLDDMVVDTVECAQQCIKYIREHNLGFGNFIILQKLRKFNLNPIKVPNGAQRLFDLVEPVDARFAPAFYSSMYDTLVTRDLSTANRVAFGGGGRRWRVVTMDGKLVDSSGTMTGGGHSVFRGAMKLKSKHQTQGPIVSDQQIAEDRAELSAKEQALSRAKEAYRQMDQQINQWRERLPQIDSDISKLNIQIETALEEETSFKGQLKELQADSTRKDRANSEVKSSTAVLSKLTAELAALKSQSSGLEKEIAEVNQKIMDAGGVELKVQKSKVDSALQRLEILEQKQSSDSMAASKAKNKIKRMNDQIAKCQREIEKCNEQIEQVQQRVQEGEAEFQQIEARMNELTETTDDKSNALTDLSDKLMREEEELTGLKEDISKATGKLSEMAVRIDACGERINNVTRSQGAFEFRPLESVLEWMTEEERHQYLQNSDALPELTQDEMEAMDLKSLRETVAKLQEDVSNAEVNLDVLEEYNRRHAEYEERRHELNEAITERDSEKELCQQLKDSRRDEFMAGFNEITTTLREMYHMITMGGNAELELVDSLDPFAEGILFSVMPPRKSWKNISNLSGGEKTLSSLALVFALHAYKPTPLYVMDEIDAALDFRNVSIVANYIKGRTRNAQFVVISLRNNMFELAEKLVGIYKVDNMTKSVTINNTDMVHEPQQRKQSQRQLPPSSAAGQGSPSRTHQASIGSASTGNKHQPLMESNGNIV